MDGKKRIARQRNIERWKKLGFGAFFEGRKTREELKALVEKMNLNPFDPMPAAARKALLGTAKPPKKTKKAKRKPEGLLLNPLNGFEPIPTEEPKGVFGCPYRVVEALEKKGYKVLGSGHYSTVLGHPKSPDKVIKVTRHQDNWIDYVKWGAENGHAGKFAPLVFSWKKFPAGWSWAVMERMDRCVGAGGYTYRWTLSGNGMERVDRGPVDDYNVIFDLLHHAASGNMMAKVYVEDLCPGAFDYVSKLRSTMAARDIRAANTMIRKDGSLCFTDPCAGETTITKTRLRKGDFSPSVWRYFIDCYRRRSQQAA